MSSLLWQRLFQVQESPFIASVYSNHPGVEEVAGELVAKHEAVKTLNLEKLKLHSFAGHASGGLYAERPIPSAVSWMFYNGDFTLPKSKI